ncbi:MAG: class I SAM-dependent methyltransferase [Acidimicrobiia bacterium]|nr:class I SAM-dependent methyltransferase [Acidimicrobiia bacterium]
MARDHAQPDDALGRWLALREAADAEARSSHLTTLVAGHLATVSGAIRVTDLATGAGSNLRHLIPHLPPRQRWLAVDRRATLLEALVERTVTWASSRKLWAVVRGNRLEIRGAPLECVVEPYARDLASVDDDALFAGCHLVTASALLDLVSESWLKGLSARCSEVGAAVLFTLSYDGRTTCAPAEPDDALVLDLFNQHQRTDKGLGGPAAGPAAAGAAARIFVAAGYQVETAPSDWVLGPDATDMQTYLIDGWTAAATDAAPGHRERIAAWRAVRLSHVSAGRSHVVVGHTDLAARPGKGR